MAALILTGCAANSDHQSLPPATPRETAAPSSTAALAFDPPITQHEDRPDLSRENRGPAALVGFEEPTTSTYDVFTYNRQSSDYSDYYDSEAVSERVGTTHR